MFKILITGGRGLIGQKLGQELVKSGFQVTAVTRKVDALNFDYPCHQISWEDLSTLQGDQFDAVVHLAGESIAESRWNENVKNQILNSRVNTTKTMQEFCVKHKIKTFVSASAIGIYGEAGDNELSEGSAVGSGFLPEVCKAWEEAALNTTNNSLRVIVFRIGIVLAKERELRQGALGRMKPIFREGFGAALGSGKQWMSWVHVDDVVGSFIWAIKNKEVEGVYNCVSPQPVTNLIFSRTLNEVFGRKRLLPNVPSFVLKMMFGEFAQFLLQSQRVIPQKLLIDGYEFKYTNLMTALKNVIPKLRPFEEELVFEQYMPIKRETVFKFFEDANNLEDITPPWLNFKILSVSTNEVNVGTIIKYKLSLYGIPIRWKTLIKDWKKNEMFIDNQESGPYERWHHTHEFEDLGEGTLMRDIVILKVPMGGLGYISSWWKVISDVKMIFRYRREWIQKNLKHIN